MISIENHWFALLFLLFLILFLMSWCCGGLVPWWVGALRLAAKSLVLCKFNQIYTRSRVRAVPMFVPLLQALEAVLPQRNARYKPFLLWRIGALTVRCVGALTPWCRWSRCALVPPLVGFLWPLLCFFPRVFLVWLNCLSFELITRMDNQSKPIETNTNWRTK